jgi:hypothetical protein
LINVKILSESLTIGTNLSQPTYKYTLWLLIAACLMQIVFFIPKKPDPANQTEVQEIQRISASVLVHNYNFLGFISRIYLTAAFSYYDTELSHLIGLAILNLVIGIFQLRRYYMAFWNTKTKQLLLINVIYAIMYTFFTEILGLYDSKFWLFEITIMFQLQIYFSMK